ncbi:MAG: hypothetical protein LBT95_09115, partial [Treponema sp.]|nr:hypothetical protein [Treponema sp.]
GVYEFASPINLNQISIIDNIKKVTLPVINSEKERIYTLRYDGKTAALFSIAPFNLDIINKIWSIPTSDSFGSFFAVGFFAPRKNPQDGYVLTGNIFPDQEAWRDSVDVNRPSWLFSPGLPYFSAITQNGEIANEKIIRVRDNPEEIYFTSFLEESPEELIFIGSSYYAGTEREKTFLLSMSADGASTNYYYTDFVNDIDEDQYDLWNGGVIVSRGPEKYGLGMTLFERETNLAKIYVVNVDKTGFNAVQHSKLWESPPPDDISFIDMIYDSAHNMYVILGRKWEAGTEIETGSVIFFIDAVTGNAKFSPISQNRFFLNKILKVGGDYYVGGSYDSDSGAFEGILHKILPGAGQFDWSAPVRFFSDDKNGSLSIKNLLEDDKGNLILAGLTNAKPDGWSYLPWLCAFNPGRKEIIWQNVYREIPYNQDESLNNYEIYSVYPNGIGSYLIEIYNGYSGHSFLLSTDMTGKMSNKELPPVPRNLNYYPSVLSYPILGSKAKKNPQ